MAVCLDTEVNKGQYLNKRIDISIHGTEKKRFHAGKNCYPNHIIVLNDGVECPKPLSFDTTLIYNVRFIVIPPSNKLK